MHTLYVDIETSPNLAYVWGLWKQTVGIKALVNTTRIMSFSALWDDSDDILYMDSRGNNDSEIVRELINLFDEAELIVGHNVKSFDISVVNGRALTDGISPPSPYKVADTYRIARSEFRLPSYSLAFLSKTLNCEHKKLTHGEYPGFELWAECMKGNDKAWEEMKTYNIEDTFSVRDLYKKMRPWFRNHPNSAIHDERNIYSCSKCSSIDLAKRGFYYTNSGKYQRFRCNSCGGWSRTRYTEYNTSLKKKLLTNAG